MVWFRTLGRGRTTCGESQIHDPCEPSGDAISAIPHMQYDISRGSKTTRTSMVSITREKQGWYGLEPSGDVVLHVGCRRFMIMNESLQILCFYRGPVCQFCDSPRVVRHLPRIQNHQNKYGINHSGEVGMVWFRSLGRCRTTCGESQIYDHE